MKLLYRQTLLRSNKFRCNVSLTTGSYFKMKRPNKRVKQQPSSLNSCRVALVSRGPCTCHPDAVHLKDLVPQDKYDAVAQSRREAFEKYKNRYEPQSDAEERQSDSRVFPQDKVGVVQTAAGSAQLPSAVSHTRSERRSPEEQPHPRYIIIIIIKSRTST